MEGLGDFIGIIVWKICLNPIVVLAFGGGLSLSVFVAGDRKLGIVLFVITMLVIAVWLSVEL